MKQKLIGSIADIQAHPEKYKRVWTVELMGELVEGLWIVLPMSYTHNFFVYYQNETLYLTDNQNEEEG